MLRIYVRGDRYGVHSVLGHSFWNVAGVSGFTSLWWFVGRHPLGLLQSLVGSNCFKLPYPNASHLTGYSGPILEVLHFALFYYPIRINSCFGLGVLYSKIVVTK